jgi:hypothetical protein
MFFLDKNPSSLANMRDQIYTKINKTVTLELQEQIRRFGGELLFR